MLENAFTLLFLRKGAPVSYGKMPKNKEAAECLKLTTEDMKQMQVIERIIPEEGLSFSEVYTYLEELLWKTLEEKAQIDLEEAVGRPV